MSRSIRLLLSIAGAIVVAFLVHRVGGELMLGMFREIGWAFLLITAVYTVHITIRAVALWRCLGPSLRFRDVLRVRFSGEAVEMLTFTGPFLSEPTKAMLLKQLGVGTADAFGGLAAEYLVYIVVGFWMAAGALTALYAREALGAGFQAPIVALLATLGVFTTAFVFAAVTRTGLIAPSIRRLGRAIGCGGAAAAAAQRVEPVETVIVAFLHDRPARLVEVMGIEVVAHALLATDLWIALRALGFPVGIGEPLILEGAIKLVGLLFFYVPGELGASESIYVVLATALRFGAAAGLTIALVRRVRALIIGAIGLAVLTGTKARDAQKTAALEERRRA